MNKIFQFIILSIIFFSSCASFKNLEYESILSLDELNGIYVDTIGNYKMDNRVSYSLGYRMEQDTADIYNFQFIDNKYLKVSVLTEEGFKEMKRYKGKYNKKENYLQISIDKKILPFIILTSYLNERSQIGKGKNNNLLIDYRHESFGMLIPFGASNYDYQTSTNLVQLKNIEYIPTKFDNKFGYTNCQGETIIEPQYDFARIFKSNVARVKVNDKWGLIDKNGNYIFEPQFDYISNIYQDSIAYVVNGNYVGLINKNGTEILPDKKLEITEFYELKPNVYQVYKNKKRGIYNSVTKEYIAEPIYDNITTKYSSRYSKEWANNDIEPYYILTLNKQKAILVNDTLVVPLTPKIKINDIYSLTLGSGYWNNWNYEKKLGNIYTLKIDFSNTSITQKDIYPFFLKIGQKIYLIDHNNNYYEVFSAKQTFKMAFSGKEPHRYIENTPLTYEEVIELSKKPK